MIKMAFREELSLGKLVTPALDKRKPVYGWFQFAHAFSEQLVEYLITVYGVPKGGVIHDPFLGSGTVPAKAVRLGYSATGFDISPLSVLLSEAKSSIIEPAALLSAAREAVRYARYVKAFSRSSDIAVVQKGLTPTVYDQFLRLRAAIEVLGTEAPEVKVLLVVLLSLVDKFSTAVKGGGFLRYEPERAVSTDVMQEFMKTVDAIVMQSIDNPASTMRSDVRVGDARTDLPATSVDAVITSPPYPNRHDYTRIYSIELALLGNLANDQLKQLRYRTLRSHVEAKIPALPTTVVASESLSRLDHDLRGTTLNNSQVRDMVIGYFHDMTAVLRQTKHALKTGGWGAFVVSNAQFGGVPVEVDSVLAEIAGELGFQNVEVVVARYRGNSAQQMRQFNRVRTRESIVVFKK